MYKKISILLKRLINFGFFTTIRLYIMQRKGNDAYIAFLIDYLNSFLDIKMNDISEGQAEFIKKTIVWTMWWQGESELPEILQICHASHQKFIVDQGYNYVMITKDNYKHYIQVPKFIEEKLRNGKISFTHFSDILRILLVEKYGGAWIDITLLLTSPLSKEVFEYPFYSFNFKNTNYKPQGLGQSISKCNWAGFMLCSSSPKESLFTFVKDALIKYWSVFDTTIDYFLLNLIIRVVYLRDESIKKKIDNIPTNNSQLYKLQPLLNSLYTKEVWNAITIDTQFFKTTQKLSYRREIEGALTFYGYLCKTYNL